MPLERVGLSTHRVARTRGIAGTPFGFITKHSWCTDMEGPCFVASDTLSVGPVRPHPRFLAPAPWSIRALGLVM